MLETQTKSVKVGKLVNTKHVDTIIRNYKKERWVANSKRLGKEDSLSVWYSIEELEEYLAIAKEAGADGMKLYFGAYDENYSAQPLYAGRQTVVLVATKKKETDHGCVDKDLYVPTATGTTIMAYNVGKLCPPICSGGDDGGLGGDWGGLGITIVDKGQQGIVIV